MSIHLRDKPDGASTYGRADASDFGRFCAKIGLPELTEDPGFADHKSRKAHSRELESRIGEALAVKTSSDWMDIFGTEFACAPVLRIDEVLEDPQVQHLTERGPRSAATAR